MDLRYFLSLGMIMSGIFVFMLGFAKVLGVHSIGYFIAMQVSGTSQCGNFMIFLSLRFYVKSYLGILEVKNLPL